MKLSSVSFFCPALNEQDNLPRLLDRALEILPQMADRFSITVIDDGSTDHTADVVLGYSMRDARVRLVRHERTLGYGTTLAQGFSQQEHDWLMYTDGDCQYDIAQILPHLSLLTDHDIISGYVVTKAASLRRKIQSGLYNGLVRLLFGNSLKDINCAMKVYSRQALAEIPIHSQGFFVDAEMLIRAQRRGFTIAQFPVTHLPRTNGTATGSRISLVAQTIIEMTKFRLGLL